MELVAMIAEAATKTDAPRLTKDRLQKLQDANLRRATAADAGISINVKDEADRPEADRLLAGINDYLRGFLPPGPCPCCDCRFGFEWGITHGEGNCQCGYPARAIHDLGDEVGTLSNLRLWYHPSEVVQAK